MPTPLCAVRLAGGADVFEGRVEVFHPTLGWGTVCDDVFADSAIAAQVRQGGLVIVLCGVVCITRFITGRPAFPHTLFPLAHAESACCTVQWALP